MEINKEVKIGRFKFVTTNGTLTISTKGVSELLSAEDAYQLGRFIVDEFQISRVQMTATEVDIIVDKVLKAEPDPLADRKAIKVANGLKVEDMSSKLSSPISISIPKP